MTPGRSPRTSRSSSNDGIFCALDSQRRIIRSKESDPVSTSIQDASKYVPLPCVFLKRKVPGEFSVSEAFLRSTAKVYSGRIISLVCRYPYSIRACPSDMKTDASSAFCPARTSAAARFMMSSPGRASSALPVHPLSSGIM